jgi:tetratricopeptide (TPR) repeat protein
VTQLDKAGQSDAVDPEMLAIRDKSNLVLGTLLLEQGEFDRAKPYFNRVRLEGPFANQALLSAGWANVSTEDFERAIVPWGLLAQREVTDRATQEALLALPYAYAKLNVHGRAAVFYGHALDSFGEEVTKLNDSIDSIRNGRFLEALIREEIRQDKDWVIRLRSLPEAPETYYLTELLATHEFQTGLQNYLDLADLRRKLHAWQSSFDSFDEMVDIRHGPMSRYCPMSIRSSGNSIRGCACASSNTSNSSNAAMICLPHRSPSSSLPARNSHCCSVSSVSSHNWKARRTRLRLVWRSGFGGSRGS